MAMARMTSNEQWWNWRDTPEPQQQSKHSEYDERVVCIHSN